MVAQDFSGRYVNVGLEDNRAVMDLEFDGSSYEGILGNRFEFFYATGIVEDGVLQGTWTDNPDADYFYGGVFSATLQGDFIVLYKALMQDDEVVGEEEILLQKEMLVEDLQDNLLSNVPISNAPISNAPSSPLTKCDVLASDPLDVTNLEGVKGVSWADINIEEALPACKKYIDNNPSSARAQFLYGRVLNKNMDYDRAVYWFSLAAEQGHSSAQFSLGLMYFYGLGIGQDYEKTVYWYSLAAEQGHVSAQTNLGYMYGEEGQGVEQDFEKAVYWYSLAIKQNNAVAQNNLGYLYRAGNGVEQDFEKAVFLFKLAAEQGDIAAQDNLGYMYSKGQGIEQDFKKQYIGIA